jgi:hypothetical protein
LAPVCSAMRTKPLRFFSTWWPRTRGVGGGAGALGGATLERKEKKCSGSKCGEARDPSSRPVANSFNPELAGASPE